MNKSVEDAKTELARLEKNMERLEAKIKELRQHIRDQQAGGVK